MSLSSLTVADIREMASTEFNALEDAKVQECLDRAINERQTLYNGQLATLPQVDGNEQDFVKLLAAHHAQMKMGGDPTNEGATGGDASYSVVQHDRSDGLLQTRYGRQASNYLRDEQSIGVVRSR
jgi:hypothetical protein